MSTRVIKPEAGKIARASETIVESGDGVWYYVVGGIGSMASLVGTILATINGGVEFLALVLPALFYFMSLVAYKSGTLEIPNKDAEIYIRAVYHHMPRLVNTPVGSFAKPLIESIYQHTADGHPGNNGYGQNCKLCLEREETLKELIPQKALNRTDIDSAKRYLEMKKESDRLVLEEYNKLMIEQ